MTDESRSIQAAQVGRFVTDLIDGWKVYSVVLLILWSYGQFWLDDQIARAIIAQVKLVPEIASLHEATSLNTQSVDQLTDQTKQLRVSMDALLFELGRQGNHDPIDGSN